MEQLNEINFDKYNTFFLEYWKENGSDRFHSVRPCTSTYSDIVSLKSRVYTLDPVVLTFDNKDTLPEILLNCSLVGISIDFIDIVVETGNNFSYSTSKIVEVIDTHKTDISKNIDRISAPKHYIAINTNTKSKLKFLVVNRFLQDQKIKFLNGKYDKNAVVAGFKDHGDAKKYCFECNK